MSISGDRLRKQFEQNQRNIRKYERELYSKGPLSFDPSPVKTSDFRFYHHYRCCSFYQNQALSGSLSIYFFLFLFCHYLVSMHILFMLIIIIFVVVLPVSLQLLSKYISLFCCSYMDALDAHYAQFTDMLSQGITWRNKVNEELQFTDMISQGSGLVSSTAFFNTFHLILPV